MDPQAKMYLAQSLMQRPRQYNPNPYGSALSGLANILAQRNFMKASQELSEKEKLEAEAEANKEAMAYIGLGFEPEVAEYMAGASPTIQAALLKRHLEQAPSLTVEQIQAVYPGITDEQAQAFVNLPANMQQQVGAAWIDANKPREQKGKGKPDVTRTVEKDGKFFKQNVWFKPDGTEERGELQPIPTSSQDNYFAAKLKELEAKREGETIEAGGVPVTDTMKTSIQRDITALDKIDKSVRAINLGSVQEHMTWAGEAKDAIAYAMTKSGLVEGDSNTWAANRRKEVQRLRNEIGQIFADYRRQVTGAAASMAELNRLEQIFMNEKMDPASFFGAYDQLLALVERDKGRLHEYMTEGFMPPNVASLYGDAAFDEEEEDELEGLFDE